MNIWRLTTFTMLVTAALAAMGCGDDDPADIVDACMPPCSTGDGDGDGDGATGDGDGDGDAAGDGDGDGDAAGDSLMFTDSLTMGTTIPPRHKCPDSIVGDGMGDNLSPPLAWTGAPDGTMSFAVVLYDTRYNVFHWAIWNISSEVTELPEGIPAGFEVSDPAGARQRGATQAGGNGYFGPCSDAGNLAGTYEYRLYALGTASLDLAADADASALMTAIEDAAIAMVAWEGTPE